MKTTIFTTVILLFIGVFFNANAWNTLNSGTTASLNAVFFTDENTGYAAGSRGTIIKTTDGGVTWSQQYIDSSIILYSIYFVNSFTGFAVGGGATSTTILKTTNGGINWIVQSCGTTKRLKSVYFIDANIGYAVGYTGTIVKTTDGGITWTTLTSGVTNTLYAIWFLDNSTGIIVGAGGVILKTTNGGLNWLEISSSTNSVLTAIYFQNAINGYVTTSSGTILKTTDGGETWVSHSTGHGQTLNAVYFINDNVGYVAGGKIYKTTNGGTSWTEQAIDEYGSCSSICFVNDTIGFAVGSSGMILKTTIGGGYTGSDNLSANNINALFHSNGNLFFDSPNGGAEFEVPIGSGKATIFTGGLWVGGIDNSGIIHLACEKYRQNGIDYFAGPIMDSIYYSQEQEKWNRMWKITWSEIEYHITHWSNAGYTMPCSIAEWPGNGDVSKGQSQFIAPFFDQNNDGIYDPHNGDYPLIKGDEALFFVFNDAMKEHTEGDGNKLGIEIRAMAYAFNCPEDSAFWNTMFLNYEIINKSQNTYNLAYIGAFMDFDIGDPMDDYIGCDVQRGSFYAYNGDSIDGLGTGNSYGANPPAQAVAVLGGAFMDEDGSDYGSLGIANGCDESINGLNFNDGIIDNERLGMTKFMYFNNSSGQMGDPRNAEECYNALRGYWRDGTPMTYGGSGYDSLSQTFPTDFMFPGLPSTDPCGWGTGGAPQIGWSEIAENNAHADRRGLASVGPFTMLPGSINNLDIAFVYGRDFTNPDHEAAIIVVQQRIDSIRAGFINNTSPCGPFSQSVKENKVKEEIRVYPNPANSYFDVSVENNQDNKTLTIYTIEGSEVKKFSFTGNQTRVFTNELSTGMYIVEVKTKHSSQFKKVIVAK